ncbi:hypothetical protein EH221_04425 [bacterium]|nr:MAG: hypothetical protein EH221_04425 [bacterium]
MAQIYQNNKVLCEVRILEIKEGYIVFSVPPLTPITDSGIHFLIDDTGNRIDIEITNIGMSYSTVSTNDIVVRAFIM